MGCPFTLFPRRGEGTRKSPTKLLFPFPPLQTGKEEKRAGRYIKISGR
jgi:hypothetical protein